MRVLATGVELRRSADLDYEVSGQVFADVQSDTGTERRRGTVQWTADLLARSDDAAAVLRAFAREVADTHLGDLLGDLRSAGHDISAQEFYGATFRIEPEAGLPGDWSSGSESTA